MTTTPNQTLAAKAATLDQQDPLKEFRASFSIPQQGGKDMVYLVGNSLGLQSRQSVSWIQEALSSWAALAVEGHFMGDSPYMTYHRSVAPILAELVGAADPASVVAMNGLTTNLHLLMASFYRPVGKRTKILMEAGAFPSDQYAVETHLQWHGLDPDQHIIEVKPRAGSRVLVHEDILTAIAEAGEELALVLFAGVQYATGQVFDLQSITEAGHAVGARVGFDLAHAIGNVDVKLDEAGADFATWCTYKYLNSGPGGISGIYINPRHADDRSVVRLGGWWGHNEAERFLMKKGFDPMSGAQGWQHSNGPILLLASLRGSLEVFEAAGWQQIQAKRRALGAFMRECLAQPGLERVESLTPEGGGCQFSLVVPGGKEVFNRLKEQGILGDWREPDIIRLSPVPLYNSFTDVYMAVDGLRRSL